MRTKSGIQYTRPARSLDLADRERLADELHAAGRPSVVYVRCVTDDRYDPEAIHPELDLIVETNSTTRARSVWANWALSQGVDGRYRVQVLCPNALPAGKVRRKREDGYDADVDLDMLQLERDLAAFDADDRALGLTI
ncbi:hypothetical protein [Methylobacterium sp. yr596]|uniref:hypothetical protein n=1 Tax=Methylobacterium sp. yr596 TaxID=1761800 RepID=UPI0008F3693C|nr:hypothetical protein [Methylobacterium sp. yr596]SFE90133.1 hypothetical protein SAMN04487844_107127 [Methylobacterium sp. yr596]